MSDNDIRNEIRELYYEKAKSIAAKILHGRLFNINLINQSDYSTMRDKLATIINAGKRDGMPLEQIFALIIYMTPNSDFDYVANMCIDIEMESRGINPHALSLANNMVAEEKSAVSNLITEQSLKNGVVLTKPSRKEEGDEEKMYLTEKTTSVIEQPIAARNLGFDPSAFIRQPQPQQPNMAMGQMYNPTTFITMPQGATNMQIGNTPHGNTCQCPECKGSPYWNNMNDSDKINFIKQHYELLDIHKRNVSSDEVNALINLIKNPDTINRLIKLGYTGNGSSLRLREVPPAKYNEYGKGIFNRYYEVPVGNNNIVICYNTKGELNADGYMMYTLQVKRDSELK